MSNGISVILGSSYHTDVCASVSGKFDFNLLFDAIKTGSNVMIDSRD